MIIKIDDSNRASYVSLFTEAYQKLVEEGVITESNEAGRFTSLEEFFKYIEELVQLDKNYYIKLPLDEPTLTIDANSRTISIPSNFAKCASVQSDQIAETVIFTIDRFFDYMDLMNAQTWVQWTAPAADGSMREGATYIELRDIDSVPGKIRFGWPLDSDITATPGKVQFSVRFFIKENVNGENKIVYSFNTLPASFTIQAALQPELNDEATINRPNDLFGYAVRNNKFPGQGVVAPQIPTFAAPGTNLPVTATLVDDTLTLMAQAVVGDAGSINYEWYYTSVDGSTTRPCEAYIDEEGEMHDAFGTIGVAYKKTEATKRILSDDYYSISGTVETDENGKYLDIYYYKPDESAAFVIYDGDITADIDLYEKYTTYTVPANTVDEDGNEVIVYVTGTYQVKAINNIHPNSSDPAGSQPCRLISPSDVNIVKDLDPTAIMVAADEETNPAITLSVGVGKATDDASVIAYNWQKSNTINGVMNNIADANESDYTVTEPGWYQAYVTSSLNRETRDDTSVKCKVTFMPVAPVVEYDKDQTTGSYSEEGEHTANVDKDAEVTLAVKAYVVAAGEDPSVYGEDNLYSEGLSYKWFVHKANSDDSAELTAADITGGALNGPMIKVQNVSEDVFSAYSYICEVTNHLNNETATADIDFIVY